MSETVRRSKHCTAWECKESEDRNDSLKLEFEEYLKKEKKAEEDKRPGALSLERGGQPPGRGQPHSSMHLKPRS